MLAEDNGVNLSWTAPAEDADSVTGYEILRAVGEGEMATLAADTASTATAYTDATATGTGETYAYQVKAIRGEERSQASGQAQVQIPNDPDDQTPQEDEPAAATTPGAPILSTLLLSTGGIIVLSWSEPADDGGSPVTGYRIEYSEDSGDTWQTLVEDTATTETEFTHGGLEPETTLHYRVSAINEHGAGPPSGVFSATTLSAPEIALPQVSEDPNVFLRSDNVFLQLDQETILVSNTGQTASDPQGLGEFTRSTAQAFTTGAAIRYELDSIGFSFHTIADTATAGSELTATLNEDDGGSPGKTLCILADPPSFASSGTNTFTAPTTGDTPCPQLSANTTYFAVLERAYDYDDTIRVNIAQNNNEDEGSLPGWTISSTGHFYQSGLNLWLSSSNEPRMIEVKGSVSTDTEITVPSDWSLIPSGLTAGDKFRLLFLTNTGHSPTSTDIAEYNTYVQGQAAAGHADIQDYSSWFRVVGSTADTDARDNTETTSTDTAAAIYWLNGAKAADDYGDFYDGSWDDEANPRDRAGATVTAGTVWTGSENDGTEALTSTVSRAFGSTANLVRTGKLNDSGSGVGPLNSGVAVAPATTNSYYALSGILVVGAAVNNLATGAPTVTGTPRVGEVLTAGTSGIADEDGLGAFAYQWVRFDGPTQTNIGTDSSTYTTTNDDAGKKIKVRVSFTDVKGNSEGPLSSELTMLINDSSTGVPTISGKPRVGQRLTASTSDIADPGGTDDADFIYQWVRVDGMTETDIGSDSSTYTLRDDDADKQIKVKVSFTDDEGEAEGPLESLPTESVVADDVLVQNTAQTANVIRAMSATNSGEAQQFTTGSHVAGYTLTSIGVNFNSIADTSTAGKRADGDAERGEQQQSGRRSLHAGRPGDLLRLRPAHLHCSGDRHAVPRACTEHELPGCHHPGEHRCRQYQSLHGGLGEHRFRQRDGLVNPE